MPPCIDVYVLSPDQSSAGIRELLSRYVDQSRDLYEGLQVSALPIGYGGDERDLALDDWDHIAVASLEDIVELGVGPPARAFTSYFPATEPMCGVILSFARSGEVIFGVSIDDPLNEPGPAREAKALLELLVTISKASRGWAVHEEPPPLDPFVVRPWDGPHVVASYTAESD